MLILLSAITAMTTWAAAAQSFTPHDAIGVIFNRYVPAAKSKNEPPANLPPDVAFALGRLFALSALDPDSRVSLDSRSKLPVFQKFAPLFKAGKVNVGKTERHGDLDRAFHYFSDAKNHGYDPGTTSLAIGWCGAQSGLKAGPQVMALYRLAVAQSWPKDSGPAALTHYPTSLEAAERLLPMLDPSTNAIDRRDLEQKIAALRAKMNRKK